MPPSPSKSARSINATYFTQTTTTIVHKISEQIPSTFTGVTGIGKSPVKHCWNA
jgi:hypothetical protein